MEPVLHHPKAGPQDQVPDTQGSIPARGESMGVTQLHITHLIVGNFNMIKMPNLLQTLVKFEREFDDLISG